MKPRFSIVKHRKWFLWLSSLITVAGLVVFITKGFNLGADFKSGSRVQLEGSLTAKQVKQVFDPTGIQVPASEITYEGSSGHAITVVRLHEVMTTKQEADITKQWKNTQIDTVDPLEAKITSHKALWAIVVASLCIMVYVAIRFEYRFAVTGIIALLHDAFIVMSVFALFRIEVDLLFVTAVLTIVGYSINDTIVIFDRIRENLKVHKPKTFAELEAVTDKSLWQTMTRSINTVTTVLIAALMLFFFGGPTIHHFTLALVVGLVSGAYSSIFIASPLWLLWRRKSLQK